MTAKRPGARRYQRRHDLAEAKFCHDCQTTKPISEFPRAKCRPGGIDPYCRECKRIRNRRYYNPARAKKYMADFVARRRAEDPVRFKMGELLRKTKLRCDARGIPFNLDLDYLLSITGTHCPALGIEYDFCGSTRAKGNSPSLDRFRPELGYIKGNVNVISWRANRMKLDATPEELMLLARWAMRIVEAA